MPRAIGREGRGEGQRDRLARCEREVLRDLGGMPVPAAHAVRRHRAHHLRAEQVRLEAPARAGRAAGRDDDDVLGFEQAGHEPGRQRQRAGGRVAPWDRDPGGALQLVPDDPAADRQLRQPVGPGAGVGGSVERLPRLGVGEPVVGTAVDDDGVLGQLGRQLGGRAVRQGEEDDVVTGRVVAVVGSRIRSPTAARCGWTSPSRFPAWESAVTTPSSICG